MPQDVVQPRKRKDPAKEVFLPAARGKSRFSSVQPLGKVVARPGDVIPGGAAALA